MHLKEIRNKVGQQPFRPFRICMSDGSERVITDPNLVFLTRHTVIIGILREGEDIPDETTYCDTMHITRVETVGAG